MCEQTQNTHPGEPAAPEPDGEMKMAPAKLAQWHVNDLARYRAAGGVIYIGYSDSDCPGDAWERIAVIHTAPGMCAYVWTPKLSKAEQIVRLVK